MTRILTAALLTLGDPGRLTGGYLYHRRIAELAPRHGARLDFVSLPDRPFPLPVLDAPVALRQAAECGADILVLDSIAAAFVGPWVWLRPPDRPMVAMLHQPPGGIDGEATRRWLQAPLDRLAYTRARRLLVASDALADELAAAGMARQRLQVVPPGRDVAHSAATSLDLRRGRRAAFLCVANWIPRKGIHSLLEALARLPEDTGTLHLAGDDRADRRYARRLRARLALPDLAGRVVVHGPLPREGVACLYASADVFVLPSVREPYGTVYGEAMAASLPVVGWRAGNLPYLAEQGQEGLMAEPGDVEGLVRAMHLLATDESIRRRMGEAAAGRALQRPTWEESAALFFTALREVVEKTS